MIKSFIFSIIISAAAIIVGLSVYLQPNDLSQCDHGPDINISNCQPVDAIVAISGGDTAARVSHAINLYKDGWANKIIFSGAAQDKSGPSNAAVMQSMAVKSGISEANIYLDEYSETTKQNALNVKNIFNQHGINKVILVTSGYHQRRASLEFNNRAQNVLIINSPVKSDSNWSFLWWLNPYGWWLASSELFKIIVFYASGAWS